ncbi:thioredoxin [Peptacetobacter sp.]|uniref:thioredoxin n=1 Tax=Peptacetobacter sp. TaxID=2991975 RepID=UPI002615717F|nr:thioredoxin [Peptacetobacter sp.]
MAKVINTSEFKNIVENGNGVAVVDFFATWCGPCKMLAPIFAEAGEEMKEDANFYKLDIDQSLEIAQQFNVSSVPTIIVFKDGKAVDQIVGFMPKDRLIERVKNNL